MSSLRGPAAPLLLSLCLAHAASAAVVLAPGTAQMGVAPLPILTGLPSLAAPAFSPTLAPALSLSLEGSYQTLSASLLQPGLQALVSAPRALPAAARAAAGARVAPTLAARSLPWLAAAPGHTLSGDVRFFDLPSRALGATRRVAVYLPPGYDGSPDRYPVLYVQDGQNVFDARTSFGGVEWGIDEACEALIASGRMRPSIVVAVYNGGERRLDEYTPVPDPQEGGDALGARENLRRLRDMEAALMRQGWGPNDDLSVYEVPGAGHHEAAWARRAAHVLAYLFPPDGTAR